MSKLISSLFKNILLFLVINLVFTFLTSHSDLKHRVLKQQPNIVTSCEKFFFFFVGREEFTHEY